jgi:hypothetical protein
MLPLHLSCDRSYDQIPVAIDPAAWVSLLVVLAVLAAVSVRRRRDPLLFWAAGFFGIALLAYRTYARNPDWTSELTLAQVDVQTAPRSFKLHEMVAHALNQENAKGNIDRVIRHEEMAWEILQPVPARWSYQYVPVNLGGYYIVKGDVAGGAATAEGRGWYQKAVTVLEQGREISRAVEKAYDAAQIEHGKPLINRSAARVPGAECAANPDCPRLHADLCAALTELASAFEQARLNDDARRFRSKFSDPDARPSDGRLRPPQLEFECRVSDILRYWDTRAPEPVVISFSAHPAAVRHGRRVACSAVQSDGDAQRDLELSFRGRDDDVAGAGLAVRDR